VVDLELDQGLAVITINRPEARNAIALHTMDHLGQAITGAEGALCLASWHPGATPEIVRERTGWPLRPLPDAGETPPPIAVGAKPDGVLLHPYPHE